jgi:glycosyltransferase involved in cell wall biosynthesis
MFVGDGEMRPSLEKSVESKQMSSKFHFYGACYDEKVLSQLVGAADICISPGEVGLTGITALSFGTPVISHGDFDHQMPEYEAIQPGVNGDLFEYGSTGSLAETIEKWLDTVSTQSRSEIRSRCYEIVDTTFNPKNQAKLINEAIVAHF